jgi:hypothetical protein
MIQFGRRALVRCPPSAVLTHMYMRDPYRPRLCTSFPRWKRTLRVRRSRRAINKAAPVLRHRSIAARSCGRSLFLPDSTSMNGRASNLSMNCRNAAIAACCTSKPNPLRPWLSVLTRRSADKGSLAVACTSAITKDRDCVRDDKEQGFCGFLAHLGSSP